jgi:hypothetical protein
MSALKESWHYNQPISPSHARALGGTIEAALISLKSADSPSTDLPGRDPSGPGTGDPLSAETVPPGGNGGRQPGETSVDDAPTDDDPIPQEGLRDHLVRALKQSRNSDVFHLRERIVDDLIMPALRRRAVHSGSVVEVERCAKYTFWEGFSVRCGLPAGHIGRCKGVKEATGWPGPEQDHRVPRATGHKGVDDE